MNKPRQSVLELFDPLKTPAAASRTAPATSSPDSDKENSTPRHVLGSSDDLAALAAFFERPRKPVSPIKLRNRLVDVGDVTVDDVESLDVGGSGVEKDGDDLAATDDVPSQKEDVDDDERLMALHAAQHGFNMVTPKPSSPRVPLADLALPVHPPPRKRAFKRSLLGRPPQHCLALGRPAREPSASPANILRFRPPELLPNFGDRVGGSVAAHAGSAAPDQAVQPPDATITPPTTTTNPAQPASTRILPSSTPSLLVSSSLPSSSSSSFEGSATPTKAVPLPKAGKSACDVQSPPSFCMETGGPESSFDLLNDRIELGSAANDSDSFIGEAVVVPSGSVQAMSRRNEMEMPRRVERPRKARVMEPDPVPIQTSDAIRVSEKTDAATTQLEERFTRVTISDDDEAIITPLAKAASSNAGQVQEMKDAAVREESTSMPPLAPPMQQAVRVPIFTKPQSRHRPQSRPTATALFPHLVPVSGLRIVKRQHAKTDSVSAVPASESGYANNLGRSTSIRAPPPESKPRAAMHLPQRQTSSNNNSNASVILASKMMPPPGPIIRTAAKPAAVAAYGVPSGSGSAYGGGAARVVVGAGSTQVVAAAARGAARSGLRPPSRFGSAAPAVPPASGGGASTLPKPVASGARTAIGAGGVAYYGAGNLDDLPRRVPL